MTVGENAQGHAAHRERGTIWFTEPAASVPPDLRLPGEHPHNRTTPPASACQFSISVFGVPQTGSIVARNWFAEQLPDGMGIEIGPAAELSQYH
jgi:hypothetical protein